MATCFTAWECLILSIILFVFFTSFAMITSWWQCIPLSQILCIKCYWPPNSDWTRRIDGDFRIFYMGAFDLLINFGNNSFELSDTLNTLYFCRIHCIFIWFIMIQLIVFMKCNAHRFYINIFENSDFSHHIWFIATNLLHMAISKYPFI